jgi:hypothetical protein
MWQARGQGGNPPAQAKAGREGVTRQLPNQWEIIIKSVY